MLAGEALTEEELNKGRGGSSDADTNSGGFDGVEVTCETRKKALRGGMGRISPCYLTQEASLSV